MTSLAGFSNNRGVSYCQGRLKALLQHLSATGMVSKDVVVPVGKLPLFSTPMPTANAAVAAIWPH